MSLAEPIGSMVELSINFCYNCLDQITLFLLISCARHITCNQLYSSNVQLSEETTSIVVKYITILDIFRTLVCTQLLLSAEPSTPRDNSIQSTHQYLVCTPQQGSQSLPTILKKNI